MSEYKTVTIKARDAEPYVHAVWCKIGDRDPFWNEIVIREPLSNGTVVWMLDTHNGCSRGLDEMVELGEKIEVSEHYQGRREYERKKFAKCLTELGLGEVSNG